MKKSLMLVAAAVLVIAIVGLAVHKAARNRDRARSTRARVQARQSKKEFIEARGLHVTGWIAGGRKSFGKLVDLVNATELNALCIDVKDSDGMVSYDTEVPLERAIKASRRAIRNINGVMKTMADNRIYPIARIAVFRDPILAVAKPSLAIHSMSGGIWRDRRRAGWTNPYAKAVWDYNVDLAIDAAKHGFKEIQWDYVRFPSDGPIHKAVYPGKDKRSESELIRDFLGYAGDRLKPYNVVMSADIFGLTSIVRHDMGIGQTLAMIAQNVDYICPMVYPSHYAHHEYGIPDPNLAPYETVRLSLGDHVEHLQGTKARVRPWLQDFSLHKVHYGRAEVIAQRKAAAEMGLREFLLWNPRCVYTVSALSTEKNKPPKEVEAAFKSRPFRLVLKNVGLKKEEVRAMVEESVGKNKADKLLRSLPNPVAANLSWEDAETLEAKYRAGGAVVDIR